MGPRPTHLHLNSDSDDSQPLKPPRMAYHMDMPSPRAGEIPPALSPLDAFAMHSRILAKQFEQERDGRRISRLPPLAVQKQLSSRPDYFRSISASTEGSYQDLEEIKEESSPLSAKPHGLALAGVDGKQRPVSHYPMIGDAVRGPNRDSPFQTPHYEPEEQALYAQQRSYFDLPRQLSPEPVDPRLNVERPSPTVPSLTNSYDSVQSSQPRTLANGSTHSQRSQLSEHGLLPPKSPAHPKSQRSTQSIRSVPPDSGDEDGSSYNGAYAASSSRFMTTFDSSPNARPMPTPQSTVSEVRDYYFNYRHELNPDIWRDTLETNIAAVFTTSMAFLELLDAGNKRRPKEAPTSQIIAIGSVGGLTRFTPSYIYNASKAGVHHLMKNLGATFVPFDIRTNIIAPGWFPSDMTTAVQKQWEGTGGVMPRELVPRQRMGHEDEMAGTILYLVSKAGGYCNGNIMLIDGGFLVNHAGSY